MSTYKMTITIPMQLREQMSPLNEYVNWSRVAADAFREAVKQGPPTNETSEERIRRRLMSTRDRASLGAAT